MVVAHVTIVQLYHFTPKEILLGDTLKTFIHPVCLNTDGFYHAYNMYYIILSILERNGYSRTYAKRLLKDSKTVIKDTMYDSVIDKMIWYERSVEDYELIEHDDMIRVGKKTIINFVDSKFV